MQDVCITDRVKIDEPDAADLPPANVALRIFCHLAQQQATHDPDAQAELASLAFDLADAFLIEAERRREMAEEMTLATYATADARR